MEEKFLLEDIADSLGVLHSTFVICHTGVGGRKVVIDDAADDSLTRHVGGDFRSLEVVVMVGREEIKKEWEVWSKVNLLSWLRVQESCKYERQVKMCHYPT